MRRRSLLLAACAAGLNLRAEARRYRAAVIGHTRRGNYGHGLDVVWKAVGLEVAAVADPDEAGRAKAMERSGAKRGYSDYRRMLDKERPDLVSIGPRWMDERVAMVTAAAESGAHIYLEKPFAPDLEGADRMVEVVRRNKVKLQLAHQMRCSPFVRSVQEFVGRGDIGTIHELRGRGKEDHRAGGEDLTVLGSHICDVFRIFLGDPRWVAAHVTQDGAELDRRHVTRPTESVGPVAGNQIAAMFAFENGLHAYFASRAADTTHPLRFATQIIGTKGVVFLPNAIYPEGQPYLLRDASWFPDRKSQWETIPRQEDPAAMAKIHGGGVDIANGLMALDLLDAIEKNRKPACSEEDGRWTTEMITGIYQAQIGGDRVSFPLRDRRHPLSRL